MREEERKKEERRGGEVGDEDYPSYLYKKKCRLGEIGRHKGLKIPRTAMFVPVQFR